jgi:hypothetical protein
MMNNNYSFISRIVRVFNLRCFCFRPWWEKQRKENLLNNKPQNDDDDDDDTIFRRVVSRD